MRRRLEKLQRAGLLGPSSRSNLAAMLRDKGDAAGARTQLLQVREQLAKLAAGELEEPEVRREQARVEVSLAAIHAAAGEHTQALPLREAAIASMRSLVADFPVRVVYRQELDLMLYDLAIERQQAGDVPGAIAADTEAITGHEQLVAAHPDGHEYASELAIVVHHRGYLQTKTDDAAAGRDFTRAAELIEGVVQKRPDDLSFRVQAGPLVRAAAICAARAEHWNDSRDAFRRAAEHAERVRAAGGKRAAAAKRLLLQMLPQLAHSEMMCDDFAGVVKALRHLHTVEPMKPDALREMGGEMHVDDRADFQELLRAAESAAPASQGGGGGK